MEDGLTVSVSTGVMASLLSNLSALLLDEYKLSKGLRSQIARLRDELSVMHSAVAKLADMDGELDVQTKDWARKVRELSYDLDDIVDVFLVRHGSSGDSRGFLRTSLEKRLAKHEMANQIEALKAEVVDVANRRPRCLVDAAVSNPSRRVVPINPRSREIFEELMVGGLVGMDGPRDEVVRLLMDGEPEVAQRLRVVSVVGAGGIGKTSLAKVVYSSTRSRFDCSAFVSVSRDAVAAHVLTDILSQIGQPIEGGISDELTLIKLTRECLKGKRYLLVLDDIWSISSWRIINGALPENNHGSRIITTTRIESVAEICCSHWDDYVYEIPTLSACHAEELFYRRVYGCQDSCPPDLKQISEKILKKCGGLPLAIIAIASLLAGKPNAKEHWEMIQNLVCSAHEKSPDVEPTKRILAICYYSLPHQLRPCLLSFCSYPEKHNIRRDHLVWRWIAEGFISQEKGESLQKTGELYFNELISRSMTEPIDIEYDGTVHTCRVHSMVLDLIITMAVEENFITLLDAPGDTCTPRGKIRRFTLANINEDHYAIPRTNNLSHCRYLALFGPVKNKFPLKNLRFLRALELRGCKYIGENDLGNIGNLFQLKYLAIQDMTISKLPAQIARLPLLETLYVRKTRVRELPTGILKLRRLCHLHVDWLKLPDKIGNMLELSRLGRFDILQSPLGAVQDLGYLLNLRELLLFWSADWSCCDTHKYDKTLISSLGKLVHLQSLDIDGNDCNLEFLDCWSPSPDLERFHVSGGCYLLRASKWMASHSSLVYISINISEVRMKDFQLLGGLPMLRHLYISSKQIHTEWLIVQSDQFPSLQGFYLHCPLIYLTFEPLAMPKLLSLLLPIHVLTAEANGFSFGIEHLLSLKKVDARISSEGADASKTKAAEVAIRKAADSHPNRPILDVVTWCDSVEKVTKDEEELDTTV